MAAKPLKLIRATWGCLKGAGSNHTLFYLPVHQRTYILEPFHLEME